MFGFLRKNNAAGKTDEVERHLEVMGYDLLPYGAAVAMADLSSGYNAVETASHLAFTTMARDIRKSGEGALALMAFQRHGAALLDVLKEYKDRGMMNPTQWQNDSRAIIGITTVNGEQSQWLDTVLSDPVAGKERLAKSRL